jgi:hypothetical protein
MSRYVMLEPPPKSNTTLGKAFFICASQLRCKTKAKKVPSRREVSVVPWHEGQESTLDIIVGSNICYYNGNSVMENRQLD